MRNRYVCYKGPAHKEIQRMASKGCPQGSVLGPHLWNLVMDDLLKTMNSQDEILSFSAFADDLTVLIKGHSRLELQSNINQALETIHTWARGAQMEIAANKTSYSIVKGVVNRNPTIRLNNQHVSRQNVVKFLGLLVDEKLHFLTHIPTICAKSKAAMQKIASIAQRDLKIPLRHVQI